MHLSIHLSVQPFIYQYVHLGLLLYPSIDHNPYIHPPIHPSIQVKDPSYPSSIPFSIPSKDPSRAMEMPLCGRVINPANGAAQLHPSGKSEGAIPTITVRSRSKSATPRAGTGISGDAQVRRTSGDAHVRRNDGWKYRELAS